MKILIRGVLAEIFGFRLWVLYLDQKYLIKDEFDYKTVMTTISNSNFLSIDSKNRTLYTCISEKIKEKEKSLMYK